MSFEVPFKDFTLKSTMSVSYTHLDVYKRQVMKFAFTMKLNRVEQGVLYSCRKVGKRMMKYKKVFVIFISIMFSLSLIHI